MGLFHFGKKKEEKTPDCSCSCQKAEVTETTHCCYGKVKDSNLKVQILGSGCKNCHKLLENTQAAVNAMGLYADIEYVTDLQKIMDFGVMSMPALVVNDEVVSMGKVLRPSDIEPLLRSHVF